MAIKVSRIREIGKELREYKTNYDKLKLVKCEELLADYKEIITYKTPLKVTNMGEVAGQFMGIPLLLGYHGWRDLPEFMKLPLPGETYPAGTMHFVDEEKIKEKIKTEEVQLAVNLLGEDLQPRQLLAAWYDEEGNFKTRYYKPDFLYGGYDWDKYNTNRKEWKE